MMQQGSMLILVDMRLKLDLLRFLTSAVHKYIWGLREALESFQEFILYFYRKRNGRELKEKKAISQGSL